MTEEKFNHHSHNYLIIIAGPTASGKSSMALEIARHFDAEIFSADSRQIYQEMVIGTAIPDQQQLSQIRHHFIHHVSIHQNYSAGKYLQEITKALNAYFKSHQVGVLCGGTGLYIRAILEGLDEFPDISPEAEKKIASLYENEGLQGLQKMLADCDPDYYSMVDLSNPMRLIRALSVFESSGLPFSSYLKSNKGTALPFNPVLIMIGMDREKLYQRINQRVDDMIAGGLLEEARLLYKHKDLKALQTVGYSELFDYLDGKSDFQTAVNMIKQNSRRYAKRQMTWFRKHGEWEVFGHEDSKEVIQYIEKIMADNIKSTNL